MYFYNIIVPWSLGPLTQGKRVEGNLDNSNKIILDLCGGTGSWSRPYKEAGYDVRIVTLPHGDTRLFKAPVEKIHGILAAPPCTHFSGSGARWWKGKGDAALLEGLSVTDACMRIVAVCKPVFWALENPVGRLRHYLGDPALIFNPCDYGDPYTKKTLLWGCFNHPAKNPVEPTDGSKLWRMYGGTSDHTKEMRSITPAGFAQAFYEANK
jgi:hypothetical protein